MNRTIIKDPVMRTVFIVAILALGLLTACSKPGPHASSSELVTAQVPVSSGYPLSTQPMMQAMAHWDRLASSVAENCAKAINHFYPEDGLRVYVAPMGVTPFAKAFRESLLTRLVDYGVPISFEPEGAAILEANLALVTHQRALDRTPGGRRLAVDPGFVQRKDEKGRFLPVPVVYEESGYFDPTPSDTEVQINAGLVYQNAYLYRNSSIFYVDGKDWAHYQLQAPRGQVELKRFSLVQ